MHMRFIETERGKSNLLLPYPKKTSYSLEREREKRKENGNEDTPSF